MTSDGFQTGKRLKVQTPPDTNTKDRCEYENKSLQKCGKTQSSEPYPGKREEGVKGMDDPPNLAEAVR